MNILTFDIEDWFHILDHGTTRGEMQWMRFESRIQRNTDRILEVLARKNRKATFFCLGWIAKRYPEVIKKIDSLGHDVGSHSYLHQLAYEQSREEFRSDLNRSIQIISDLTGKKVRSYRAPGFSFTRENTWVFDCLAEAGIEYDCSIFPARRAHGGFDDFGADMPAIVKCHSGQVKEFPINTVSILGRPFVFSGGGYFRLLPYFYVKGQMLRSQYVMCYFHPRDFDPGQPVLNDLPAARRFKSYVGLNTAFGKFGKLLDDFMFYDLSRANAMIDWTHAQAIALDTPEKEQEAGKWEKSA